MNLMFKKFFIHDTVMDPIGQRGVNRCYSAYAQALVDAYPGQVFIYSARPSKIEGAKIIPWPSIQVGSGYISRKIARFDNLFGANLADLSSQIYYSPFYGYMRTKIPQVFTALDMIYEKFPQFFSSSDQQVQQHIKEKKECFNRASLIISISQNTVNDILELYPDIPENKLRVVYLGVDDLFFQPGDDSKCRGKPYFLFVGNRGEYKNFLRFMDAFGKSGLKKSFDLRIISPVQNDFNTTENEVIMRHKLEDYIKLEYAISDEELKRRYAEAYAFVYPTEYEGFGLPVVEALASGTLVLTSNTSSLAEIGGPAPLYFDPLSVDSIMDTLKFAGKMTDSTRQERILAGKNWASQFTWQNSQRSFVSAVQTLFTHRS